MAAKVSKSGDSGSSPWSQLPEELLDLILLRITDPSSLFHFGRVCSSWRSALILRRRSLQPPPLFLARNRPEGFDLFWLGAAGEGKRFRRLSRPSIRSCKAKQDYTTCSMGWLFFCPSHFWMHNIHLLHPISGEKIHLPSALSRPDGTRFYHAILSSPPACEESVVVAAGISDPSLLPSKNTRSKYYSLCICRPGRDQGWTMFYCGGRRCTAMAFLGGRLYCLEDKGVTKVFHFEGFQPWLMDPIPRVADYRFYRTHLVESDGELLLVILALNCSYRATEVHVFKLQDGRWVEIWSLGDRVLLIDRLNLAAESFSWKETMASGFRPNSIYYLDNEKNVVHVYSVEGGNSWSVLSSVPTANAAHGCWIRPRE